MSLHWVAKLVLFTLYFFDVSHRQFKLIDGYYSVLITKIIPYSVMVLYQLWGQSWYCSKFSIIPNYCCCKKKSLILPFPLVWKIPFDIHQEYGACLVPFRIASLHQIQCKSCFYHFLCLCLLLDFGFALICLLALPFGRSENMKSCVAYSSKQLSLHHVLTGGVVCLF